MKKLLAATLTFMMLAPTSVQAQGKMVNVVTKIGKNTVTYNKDGLLTGNNYFSIRYKNGKITSLKISMGLSILLIVMVVWIP